MQPDQASFQSQGQLDNCKFAGRETNEVEGPTNHMLWCQVVGHARSVQVKEGIGVFSYFLEHFASNALGMFSGGECAS